MLRLVFKDTISGLVAGIRLTSNDMLHRGDWITDFVILEAKAMLKSRKYTVQQIADALNFANQSFFGKYFKDKVGCSPTQYQRT